MLNKVKEGTGLGPTRNGSTSDKPAILPDAPPLVISFDDQPLEHPDDVSIDLPKPPTDPVKVAKIINYTGLMTDILTGIAKANAAYKFTFEAPTLYNKPEKGDREPTDAIISVGHNAIHCYNPAKRYANGKTSLEIAAEAILKLPAEKRPKLITLSNGNPSERQKFAKVLRAQGIDCKINVLTVDAQGNKQWQEVDKDGKLHNQLPEPVNEPQNASPTLRS